MLKATIIPKFNKWIVILLIGILLGIVGFYLQPITKTLDKVFCRENLITRIPEIPYTLDIPQHDPCISGIFGLRYYPVPQIFTIFWTFAFLVFGMLLGYIYEKYKTK